jgi:hypothetical protein
MLCDTLGCLAACAEWTTRMSDATARAVRRAVLDERRSRARDDSKGTPGGEVDSGFLLSST